MVRAPRDLQAIRTLPGGGWTIPGRCDAVVSVISPAGTTLNEVRDSIDAFLRMLEQEDGEVRFEFKVLPMGAGRLWLRPGETDPNHRGVKAIDEAVERGARRPRRGAQVQRRLGGRGELMRTGRGRLRQPGGITFGPGDFEQAHAVDEHIAIAEVPRPPRSTRARPSRCWAEGNEGRGTARL